MPTAVRKRTHEWLQFCQSGNSETVFQVMQDACRGWFGLEDIPAIPKFLSGETLTKLLKANLMSATFPNFSFSEQTHAPGLQFDSVLRAISGLEESRRLYSGVYLVDFTPVADFATPRDPMYTTIASLAIKRSSETPPGSRFDIPGEDWGMVSMAYADSLDLGWLEGRLERAIEFYAISNLFGRRYRTLQWFADSFTRLGVRHQLYGNDVTPASREPQLMIDSEVGNAAYPNVAGRPIFRFPSVQ